LRSGSDVLVIGIDAVRNGFELLIAAKLNALVECNPILGEVVLKVVKQILAGQRVPPVLYTEERVFTVHNAKAAFPTRKY
jgi:hypothetical protein